MSSNAFIYQIYYSDETEKLLDRGFMPINNRANARPDWREYWPIRWFLQNNRLNSQDYYGFFSPKFFYKTNLSSVDVARLVGSIPADCDVVHFSPFSDFMTFHLNVFEQGDAAHPGLQRAADALFASLGFATPPSAIVNHSDNAIFCNYFIAKPAFWEEWLRINEEIFEIAENQPGEIADQLRQKVEHDGQSVEAKVFVMERVASYLLATQSKWKPYNACPFAMPSRDESFDAGNMYVTSLDALKRAYVLTNIHAYQKGFLELRDWLLRSNLFIPKSQSA